MGPSAHLSAMRRHFVLRQLAQPPRQQTRAQCRTSGDRVRATRRALVVLLFGRHVLRILGTGAGQKFFVDNLAVFHCVNADLGQFSSLL